MSIEALDNYIKSNPRLAKHSKNLQSEINSVTFSKLINAAQGVRKIHEVQLMHTDGSVTIVPMRLLSVKELRELNHATLNWLKSYPGFLGGEHHPMFNQRLLAAMLSRATTPAPEINEPFLSIDEVEDLPVSTFNDLVKKYQELDDEYNIRYNPNIDEELDHIILAIFNGLPIDEKKLSLLTGLNFSTLLALTIRLCNASIELADNIQFITSLKDLRQKEIEESTNQSITLDDKE